MSTKAQGHGGHKPSLRELHQEFQSLQLELENHLDKEERDLFPVIAAMSRGEESSSGLDEPIGGMIHEHEGAGSALSRLRELSQGFVPPPEACNTYRALFAGLHDLEQDLHCH